LLFLRQKRLFSSVNMVRYCSVRY